MNRCRLWTRALPGDRAGNAFIELALALPVLITLGMYGTEIAYMATVNMQVSQIAASVADNASRLGQTDNSSVTPTVTEADIDSIMGGALEQGSGIGLAERGRIILSSLEREPASGRQYIHWQRCRGDLDRRSDYDSAAASAGLGQPERRVSAPAGSAVMFAEVFYAYEGLFGDLFVGTTSFKKEAAFLVRDDRNLTPGVTGHGGNSACT